MKILFTVCGRAGSKGIKNKNIRKFCGKYIVLYALSAINLYLKKYHDDEYDIVINSDSQELLNIASNSGLCKVDVIMRDPSLAGDIIGKIEVINDCLIKMQQRKNLHYDVVVDLDITSPLRTVDDIRKVIDKHIATNADVTTTAVPARRNPYFNQLMKTEHGVKKVIDSNFTARQQTPEVFDMNASIYAYKPQHLTSGRQVLDGYCEIVEMIDTGILDLDRESDFELMEAVAVYMFRTYSNYREIYENII